MTTINGRACVANGRNLLLDTDFNNLPQYWTSRAGTVTGTFNGHNVIYYDATTISSVEVLKQPIYDPSLTNNRVLPSHWYTLSFYAKGVGQMNTYVYSSFVDTSAGSYIDGVKSSYIGSDGGHVWDLTDDWTRHAYTFKSKSSFPTTDVQNVLFRAFKGNTVYITMPKLETGTLATPWTPTPVDKVFSNGKQVYGRNLLTNTSDFSYNWYGIHTISATTKYDGYSSMVFTSNTQKLARHDFDLGKLQNSTKYTASFWAKADNAGDRAHTELWGSNGVTDFVLTTDWVRYTAVLTSASDANTNISHSSCFFGVPANNIGNIYIALPKLEKGSIATPWSQAPEDVM